MLGFLPLHQFLQDSSMGTFLNLFSALGNMKHEIFNKDCLEFIIRYSALRFLKKTLHDIIIPEVLLPSLFCYLCSFESLTLMWLGTL